MTAAPPLPPRPPESAPRRGSTGTGGPPVLLAPAAIRLQLGIETDAPAKLRTRLPQGRGKGNHSAPIPLDPSIPPPAAVEDRVIPQTARTGTGFPAAQTQVVPRPQLVATRNDPLNRMALYFGLAYVFVQFTALPQLVGYILRTSTYLPYLIGLPAAMAALFSGGLRNCFRGRPAYYWTAFGCWMWAIVPFASWPGAAVPSVFTYWRASLIMLFIVGSILCEWNEVRKFMNVMAAAGVVNVLCARFLKGDFADRLSVQIGSIGNPNDYAGHLLLMLPFLVWVLLQGKIVSRIVALGCIAAGLYLIIATSSRGAVLALGADVIFWLLAGTARQKMALVLVVPIAVVALVATIPESSARRLMEIWTGSAGSAESAEALDSSRARQYVLTTSIRYTLEHPLFGVGPSQFPMYEGGHEVVVGTHGYWHETHNSFTQASAECGIPGFLLFAAGVLSTFLLFRKTLRDARKRTDCQDMALLIFCIMLGMTGFITAITFLNFAYYFYLPTLGGLAVGVRNAAQREFERRDAARAATPA